ncbi:unnamed protein product [Ixodes persulcatus]
MTFLMNKSLKLQTRGLFLWLRPRNQSEEIDDFLAQLKSLAWSESQDNIFASVIVLNIFDIVTLLLHLGCEELSKCSVT